MRRLYQQIADQIRRRIEHGDYAVGERMPAERLLADEFNVSRPTIREAMIALEITGLVDVRKGSGVHVIARSSGSLAPIELDIGPFELLEARLVVESEIAGLAAERIDDVQMAQLGDLLEEMARENEIGDIGEKADHDFHITLAEATHNSALVDTAERYWSLRETSPMVAEMLNRSRAYGVQPMIEDHKAIVDALRLRDRARAHGAMSNHITRVIDALLEVTETDEIERLRKDAEARRERFIRKIG